MDNCALEVFVSSIVICEFVRGVTVAQVHVNREYLVYGYPLLHSLARRYYLCFNELRCTTAYAMCRCVTVNSEQ